MTATWRIGAVAISVMATHPGEWAVRIEEPPTRNLVVPFGCDLDKAATFCDCFRVQLETERWKLPQIVIFIAKVIWRAGDLLKPSHKKP